MRFQFAALVLAGFVLAACETTPDGGGSAAGTGAATANASDSASSSVSSQPLPGGVQPGSPEDLAVNVGDRVLFGFDRFDLSAEARDTLEKQSVWLKRYPNGTIVISGHTDERGTREYNLALGERRATAVKNYLVALGIEPSRVNTISYGKERPVDPQSSQAAWASNRRGVTQIDSMGGKLSN
ncbi:MAG: peptidoglycan-associated lipoprotein Pal [Rhodospirillales bacterium]|nr:peptidoglycan-associated lipoprotein Pal [Rhodospirillales bacterium]